MNPFGTITHLKNKGVWGEKKRISTFTKVSGPYTVGRKMGGRRKSEKDKEGTGT